jgi:propionyl-CoA carboxylase alpha chain
VIEEAPSPFLDEQTRRSMGEQAVALSKAVGYHSAGTVEFIVDGDRNFYFLEMNTRLQVEHPVTELITGVDLVEQMIRVAAGEALSFTQSDVKLNGWALESRLYAEDPYRNFLPSIGRLTRYRPPREGDAGDGTIIRNDTGVSEGGEISIYYDPMVAKLCTWGPDRISAIDAMSGALDRFEVEGIGHNLPFLSAVMRHERFREGNLTTAFIAEEFPDGFHGVEPDEQDARKLAAIATVVNFIHESRSTRISGTIGNHQRVVGNNWVTAFSHWSFAVAFEVREGGATVKFSDFATIDVQTAWLPGLTLGAFQVDGENLKVKISRTASGLRLRWRGIDLVATVREPRTAELARLMPQKRIADTSKKLLCPMPGVISSILVAVGEEVQPGQALAVVEAMKMENMLRSEKKGVVKSIHVAAGASLAVDEVILEFA